MFLHISKVTYLDKYKLRLTFSNEVIKDVDLKNELYGEVFANPSKILKYSKG